MKDGQHVCVEGGGNTTNLASKMHTKHRKGRGEGKEKDPSSPIGEDQDLKAEGEIRSKGEKKIEGERHTLFRIKTTTGYTTLPSPLHPTFFFLSWAYMHYTNGRLGWILSVCIQVCECDWERGGEDGE